MLYEFDKNSYDYQNNLLNVFRLFATFNSVKLEDLQK